MFLAIFSFIFFTLPSSAGYLVKRHFSVNEDIKVIRFTPVFLKRNIFRTFRTKGNFARDYIFHFCHGSWDMVGHLTLNFQKPWPNNWHSTVYRVFKERFLFSLWHFFNVTLWHLSGLILGKKVLSKCHNVTRTKKPFLKFRNTGELMKNR